MIEWGQKSKPIKIPWASNKTTPKIPGQNVTPKKSHAEFPSHKNFQKAIKKNTKNGNISLNTQKATPKKSRNGKFQTPKNPSIILVT